MKLVPTVVIPAVLGSGNLAALGVGRPEVSALADGGFGWPERPIWRPVPKITLRRAEVVQPYQDLAALRVGRPERSIWRPAP